MSRTLLVLRHAKAEAAGPRDHERDLLERGRADAARAGRFLTRSDQIPDLVLASTAARALATAEHAREAGGWRAPLRTERAIYEAETGDLLDVLRRLDDDVERVLLVAHEPGCSQLVSALVGGASLHFAPASLARVDLALGRWSELAPSGGTLRWLLDPERLAALG